MICTTLRRDERLLAGARRGLIRLRLLVAVGLCSLAMGAAFAAPKTKTATALTVSPNPAYVGQSVTFNATVTPTEGTTAPRPSGTVTFKDGNTTLGTATIVSGATLITTFSTSGSHSVTAVYGGDSNYQSSTSSAVIETINAKVNSTTTLSASPNPGYIAQTVTLTATLTGGSPSGMVTFKDGDTTVGTATVSAGTASLSTSFSTTGGHSLTASYGGDVANNASTSSAITETVNLNATTITLSLSSSPAVLGQTETLTASVTGFSPSGTVTFKDGSTTLGSGTLSNGSASLTTSGLALGSHSLTASYGGDTNNAASSTSATSLTVNKATPTIAFSASPAAPSMGQSVILSATLSGGASPSGSVDFVDGTSVLGSASLSGGAASITTGALATGSHSITANYAGDANNNAVTSSAAIVTVNQAASSTTLTVSPNPSTAGQSVTLTASIGGASPTGSVTFLDGATTLGSGSLSNGTASLTTSTLPVGAHNITASYAGDANNTASTSSAVSQTVKAITTTTVAASPNPATTGQTVTLTATIAGSNPSGTVTFLDGATTIGVGTVGSDSATLATSFSSAGAHSLTATYSGDVVNNASTSTALTETISAAPVNLPPPPTSAAPVVNLEYDAQGNPTKRIQAPGVSGFDFATSNTYDPLSRLKDSTDPKLGKTQFAYDALDRTLQITDPRNLVTQTPRNGLGDATQLVSPDTGAASLSYDAAGNLQTRTDSRGVLATYSYDALNRPTGVVYSKTGQTSQSLGWAYDQTGSGFANGVGRLTSTTFPGGSHQYSYDPLGRLASATQTVLVTNADWLVRTTGYDYDAAGHITGITYPSGRKLSISYTNGQPGAMGLAKDAASTAAPLITQIQWQPFGPAKSWLWQMASGTQAHDKSYDTSGRLVRYRLGNVIRDLSFDAADRITGYTHYDANTALAQAALDQGFSYDELGRVTGITTASASWSIGYDANGNRTGVTLNGAPSTYTTAATSNQLTSISNPARSFSYDSAGNTTADSLFTASYDPMGRMNTITKGGVTTTYTYDSQGQRVKKFYTSYANTTVFVYDQGGQLLGEYDVNGQAIREYVWLGSTPIAIFTPDPASAANPPLVYFVHADHIDTPRVVVDKNNNLRWRWMAEPFGTTAPENSPQSLGVFTQNLRFPGQYADQESGLSYNYFRDYDPTIGRYTTSDPIGLGGGINTYAYVGSNPLSAIDPKGLQGCIPVITPYGPMCVPAGPVVGGGLGAAAGGGNGSYPGSGSGSGTGLGDGGDGRGSCTLYHIVDCAGETIYVGITQQDPRARENQHMTRFNEGKIRLYECVNCKLTFVPVRQFNTRSECENAETQEIRAFRPFANDAKNPDDATTRYAKYQEWFSRRCIPCQ